MSLKVIIYDIQGEDDDFYDFDKDDLATTIKNLGGHCPDDEVLPMPILASGFDFEDFNPDFTKRKVGPFNPNEKREIRYKSKRYGGCGDEEQPTNEEMIN